MADTVYKLTHTGKQIDSAIDNAVRSDAQTLTTAQQTQARANVGGASASDLTALSQQLTNLPALSMLRTRRRSRFTDTGLCMPTRQRATLENSLWWRCMSYIRFPAESGATHTMLMRRLGEVGRSILTNRRCFPLPVEL